MFRQVLYTQFKWSRLSLAAITVTAFALPAVFWRARHQPGLTQYSALEVLDGFALLGFGLALLAFFGAFVIVAQGWTGDAAARHVYPLSLPVPWARFVAMRFGAGALLLLAPAVALWLGCLLVLQMVELPSTLRAYPGTLALRFLLGSLVGYALVFAVQYLSGKKAAYILLVVLVAFSLLVIGVEAAGYGQVVARTLEQLFRSPGPLAVFGSDWMLIDV